MSADIRPGKLRICAKHSDAEIAIEQHAKPCPNHVVVPKHVEGEEGHKIMTVMATAREGPRLDGVDEWGKGEEGSLGGSSGSERLTKCQPSLMIVQEGLWCLK